MTTTDLIKILKDTEYGAITHKSRNISLTINGKYMPDPRITLSSTSDGIAGPEIDLDIDGEFFEEQQPCEDKIIEWKRDFKEYVNSLSILNDDYKGIMEYIDEVPVTRQQLCKDAISREQAIKTAIEAADDWDGGYNLTRADIIEKAIKALPPVTSKPKTGHWITTRTFMHDGEYYCDKCKCDSPNNEKWDYCPNCGARMIEPQESANA